MNEALVFITTAMSLAMLCGAAATIGVMAICKMAGWSPVNVTVNVYNLPSTDSEGVSLAAPELAKEPQP